METEQKPVEVPPEGKISERELTRPLKTWFYQRPDGSIVAANSENDAVTLHKKFPQYGVSDGNIFAQATLEARKIYKEGDVAKAQERLLQGEKDEQAKAKGNFSRPIERKVFEPNGPTGFKAL